MRIPFSKWSPCGNITLFLEQPLPAALHVAICAAVLQQSHLYAEQSGTIDLATIPPKLTMMGGEFCVNATRAFAALLATRGYLKQTGEYQWTGHVTVSGMQSPLCVRVAQLDASHFTSAACLPLFPLPAVKHLGKGISLVRLQGIVHLILDTACHPLPSEGPEAILHAAAGWREMYALNAEDACGVIWLDHPDACADYLAITPVVRVRETDSVFLETSCGSGSLAAVLSRGIMPRHWAVRQPSGENLNIILEETPAPQTACCDSATPSRTQWQAWVEGKVDLLAEGITYVDCPNKPHCPA